MKSQSSFTRFAKWTAHMSGRPATFVLAVLIILVWAVSGPIVFETTTNDWRKSRARICNKD